MEDKIYWMSGDVSFTNEKLDMINTLILDILYKGGIRLIKNYYVNDVFKERRVLAIPAPDDNGIVYFNYSIFEGKERGLSWYNTKTGVLFSEDRGNNEYGLIMNFIMAIQEAYSDSECKMMEQNEEIPDDRMLPYAAIIHSVTGHLLDFSRRENITNEKIKATGEYPLYFAMRREHVDDFLEYTDCLPDLSFNTLLKIIKWHDIYTSVDISNVSDEDAIIEFEKIITEINKRDTSWIPEERLIVDFEKRIGEEDYKRRVMLLKSIFEEDYIFFPELSHTQVDAFILPHLYNEQRKKDFRMLCSYLLNTYLVLKKFRT